MKHQFDLNDLAYAIRIGKKPIGFQPCPITKNGKINPAMTRFLLDSGEVFDIFHVKPVYYETLNHTWRPLSEVTSYHGNKNIVFNSNALFKVHPRFLNWIEKRCQLLGGSVQYETPFTKHLNEMSIPKIGMTVTTVYPDPDPESTTVDGFVTSGYKSTMQNLKDTVTGDGANPTSPFTPKRMFIRTLRNGSGYYGSRVYMLFDTASIPDGDTISGANLSIYGLSTDYVNNSTSTYHITACNPASNTNLVASDYGNFSYTSFASIAFASLSQSAYNDFALNGSGIANVSKTGISKFGGICSQELNVAAQTSGHDNIFACYEAEQTGTSNDPKLAVTHAAAGGGQNSNFLMFMA